MRSQAWAVVGMVVVTSGGWGCAGSPVAAGAAGATATLGPGGGRLSLGAATTLVVAPGALAQEVPVRARFVPALLPVPGTARGEVLELLPHGTTFRIPARVTLPYDPGARGPLQVLRLADEEAARWEPVGGVRFDHGRATFDITHFSFYVVSDLAQCELVEVVRACDGSCACCGGATCVDLSTDAAHCGACGVACGASSFCDSSARCHAVGPEALCANRQLYVVQGELPALDVVSPEQTMDGVSAGRLAAAIGGACAGLSVQHVSQAADGLLDPCSDAPLVGGGTTLLVTGGSFAQRLARHLEGTGFGPVMDVSADGLQYTFRSRQGAPLVSFPRASLSDEHDYFVIAFERDATRGAQVLQVYGVGWQGTPAATWYFTHRVLPARDAGAVEWSRYVLVEWQGDGDGGLGEGDVFRVLAADVP